MREPARRTYYGAETDFHAHWWQLLPAAEGTCILVCDDRAGCAQARVLDRAGALALIKALQAYVVLLPDPDTADPHWKLDPQDLADRSG